jgi:hypothetical protein
MNDRILVFYPYSNIATNPSVAVLLELLSEHFQIDCLTLSDHENEFPQFSANENSIQFLPYTELLNWNRAVAAPKPQKILGKIRSTIKHAIPKGLRQKLKPVSNPNYPSANQYKFIIGVDPPGIAAAHKFRGSSNTPLIYFSFEILFTDEIVNLYEQELKNAEKLAVKDCSFVIIQDSLRAQKFSESVEVTSVPFEYMPVAPKDSRASKSNFLRENFGISSDVSIVLFQGSLASWSGRYAWQEMVEYWPENTALVVHSRAKLNRRYEKFFSRIADGRKILVTDTPVSQEDLPKLTASADIGLATYYPSPDTWYEMDNLTHLGLASGKLSYFLMCGLPVITDSRTSLAKLVQQYNIGRAFTTNLDSGHALREILSAQSDLSTNARAYYQQHLNPMNFAPQIVAKMAALKN